MIVSDIRSSETGAVLPGLLAVLRRRRYILLLSTAAGFAIGLIGYANAPQSYVSEAVLAPDVRRVEAVPTEMVVSPLSQDSPVLRTELDMIQSRSMAEKVIARLENEGVEIQEEVPTPGLVATLMSAFVGPFQAVAEPGIQELIRGDERGKADRLLSDLRVSNDGRSFTIYVTFRASDPDYAAKVANAYAESYLDHQIDVKRSAMRRASDWLGETLEGLRAELASSEEAVEAFRREAGLVETEEGSLQAQRVSALSAEMVSARAAISEAQARLEIVRSLAERSELPASAEILGSAAVQALRADQARLERRIGELRDSGAVKNLQLSALDAELSSVKQQIAEEIQRVVESLSSEISIAHRKEEALQAELAQAKEELAKANTADITLAQLAREASANRTIYESYLVRYKQMIEQDGFVAPEAQIISYAQPPTVRAGPRLSTWMLFGLGLGGGLGVAGAALREATDRRPRLPELLQSGTGVPVISLLQHLSRKEHRRIADGARDASTTFGRTVYTLRSALRLPSSGSSPVTLAVTSAFPGDGKTTLALGIGRSAAAVGMKTVVVDANLRDPMVEKASGLEATSYIDEYIGRHQSLHKLLQKDPASDLRILPARAGNTPPETLFARGTFHALVAELKRHYDLVVIDTPALQQAADAVGIASGADRVLHVVHFRTRQLQQVIASVQSLSNAGRTPDGIVLNQVDTNHYADFTEQPSHGARTSQTTSAAVYPRS